MARGHRGSPQPRGEPCDTAAQRRRRRDVGQDRRRFGPGRSLHHLIDPETGAPAVRGPLAVTVVADDAAEAEALGTAFAISGSRTSAASPLSATLRLSASPTPGTRSRWAGCRSRRAIESRSRHDGRRRCVPVAWIVARAAGLVAFGLLTLSVWLGLGMSTRILGPRRQKTCSGGTGRSCGPGCPCSASSRRGSLRPGPPFRPRSGPRPFAASWRPAAIAAGVVAGWLSLMLAVSFRLRKWIGQRGWRRLHYASFAAFGLALAHALMAGTDLV